MNSDPNKSHDTVDAIIQQRRTEKVLSERPLLPSPDQLEQVEQADRMVESAVAISGWAPFHYDRRSNGIPEPWRMYVFFHESCRAFATDLANVATDLKPGNKLPKMMNACGAMILVKWLPEEIDTAKVKQVNQEHLAATASAVQNLLLALSARGFGTYWSSGGPLGSIEVSRKLKIDENESLIAAVFVDYPFLTANKDVERISGKLREKRTSVEDWRTIISYQNLD